MRARSSMSYHAGRLEFEAEKLHALTILLGIVQGTMTTDESFELLEESDPTLVYFILKYIKKHYHRDHDLYDVVRPRLTELKNTHRAITRKSKTGEDDPVVEWFEGTHRYSELPPEVFIDIIVDKLEG